MNHHSFLGNVKHFASIATLMTLGLAQTTAQAGIYHWGDLAGADVMFLDVTENNDEASSLFAPMPGSGGPIVAGNNLHFDPQGFASQSANGESDLIDSQLSTVIMAGAGHSIDSLSISELGDYSLGGLPGAYASAEVGAAIFWTILEVDNQAVSIATQATNMIVSPGSGPNGGVFARPGDNGTAVIWNGVADIDLSGFLSSMNISGVVTKARLTFDNTLQTSAADGATAFIKKKIVDIAVGMDDGGGTVPEPTTALLLAIGLVVAPFNRRRR